MNSYLNRSVLRAVPIALILIGLVSVCNLTQAMVKGKHTASKNDGMRQLLAQGRLRTYYLHTPKSYRPDRQMPLVLMFHGSHGSGNSIAHVTRFNDLADKQGFIAVYPNGIDHYWSDAGDVSPNVNDVSFVTALIKHLEQIRNIDRQRIYATGFSNGGMLTQTLACKLSDRIAAFASVAGTLPANLASSCKPKTPVSVLMINGTDDHSVPYRGGRIGGIGKQVVSIPKTVELWRQHDGCASKAMQPPHKIDRNPDEVEISRYLGCRGGSEVMLVTVKHGGHSWPGSVSQNLSQYHDNVSEINASEVIWDFFQRHTLPTDEAALSRAEQSRNTVMMPVFK